MRTLESITENTSGMVVGAEFTDGTRIELAEPFPRSELASRAVALAAAYGVALPPGFTPPAPPPAPAETDSTPQGAD